MQPNIMIISFTTIIWDVITVLKSDANWYIIPTTFSSNSKKQNFGKFCFRPHLASLDPYLDQLGNWQDFIYEGFLDKDIQLVQTHLLGVALHTSISPTLSEPQNCTILHISYMNWSQMMSCWQLDFIIKSSAYCCELGLSKETVCIYLLNVFFIQNVHNFNIFPTTVQCVRYLL